MARRPLLAAALLLALAGCGEEKSGPLRVSAIGGAPRLANPNRELLDAASAFLLQNSAQGLVRFDEDGDIEPGLAQSWVVSNDGLVYTFRIGRVKWPDGARVTAQEVVARLRAAAAPSSRNPLRPLLGAVDEIERMTDEVLQITLKAPRPNFLQLLAEPELAMTRAGAGAGPLLVSRAEDGSLVLSPPRNEDEEDDAGTEDRPPPVRLRGERAALAVARFSLGTADLVVGGTAGDVPLARAARPPAASLAFDPVAGLLGLAFVPADGPLAKPEVRSALAMAVDRGAIVAALGVPKLQPRESLLPPGVEGLAPALPVWTADAMDARRAAAARILAPPPGGQPIRVRVAMPQGPGWRIVFALLRRDWRLVGVEAEAVSASAPADLRLVDEVAPGSLASWYLRHFSCEASRICDPAADTAMESARTAAAQDQRRAFLAEADRLLAAQTPFISIAAPVRWSLVSPRLTGFRPNAVGRHPAGELVRRGP